jgi:hypothetical protein
MMKQIIKELIILTSSLLIAAIGGVLVDVAIGYDYNPGYPQRFHDCYAMLVGMFIMILFLKSKVLK